MRFAENLRELRKQAGLSQEQLAERLHVSRQAVTKWETGGGNPDTDHLRSLAALFHLSMDELLAGESLAFSESSFIYESRTAYDMDFEKHYDIHLGGAYQVKVQGIPGEKLQIQLSSHTLNSLESDFKVKLEERKKYMDVTVRRGGKVTEAQAKKELMVWIGLPVKFLADLELSAAVEELWIEQMETQNLEFDGKVNRVYLHDVSGHLELNCSTDMELFCTGWAGRLDLNQISSTSTLHLPRGTAYSVKNTRRSNRISYALDGMPAEKRTGTDGENIIELNGIRAELLINECTDGVPKGDRAGQERSLD